MNGARSGIFFPAPWGPGEGSKGQISFDFNYKVNFNDFLTKLCVCVLINERYKTYQTEFFILLPGSCPRGGLGVLRGQKSNSVLLSVRYAIASETIRRNSTKVGMLVTHLSHMIN